MRETSTGWWAVYDVFTGMTAKVNGVPQGGLDIKQGDDLVEPFIADCIARRKGATYLEKPAFGGAGPTSAPGGGEQNGTFE